MKKLAILLIALIVPVFASAQSVIQNEAQASIYPNALQSGPKFGVDRYANLACSLNAGVASATNPIKLEDTAHASGDAAIYNLLVREDALTSSAGASGRYIAQKGDVSGKTIVTDAPPGEYFHSCSSVITGTGRTAIKSGVASNRIYTRTITCKNTSAVPSGLSISDGAGAVQAVGSVPALSAGGTYVAPFPSPLRGSVATDLSVTMDTTATSTTCCANGYISVN